ncbi:MAG: Asp23/Gls24 family envelope stress response protein [Clostridia bacterium]|nr:Asp23/Gls24 family envelope stress response protein [Clostridia bacterium]
MNMEEFKPSEGSCIISEDVIGAIAATAAAEIPGVAGMAKSPADLRGIVAKGVLPKSVKVVNNEHETVLDVYVNLKQGAKIQDTAAMIQQSVKSAVQAMTGKPVTRVNVHVAGMVLDETQT